MLLRLIYRGSVLAPIFAVLFGMGAKAATVSILSENTTSLPSPVVDNYPPSSQTGIVDHVVPPPDSQSGLYRSPFQNFDQTMPPAYALASYTSVRNGSATYDFKLGGTILSLLWGSPDRYNTISFYGGLAGTGTLLGSFTGSNLAGDLAHPFPTFLGLGHDFVTFQSTIAFLSVVLSSTNPAFEFSNLLARNSTDENPIPVPPAAILFGTALVGLTWLGRRKRRGLAT